MATPRRPRETHSLRPGDAQRQPRGLGVASWAEKGPGGRTGGEWYDARVTANPIGRPGRTGHVAAGNHLNSRPGNMTQRGLGAAAAAETVGVAGMRIGLPPLHIFLELLRKNQSLAEADRLTDAELVVLRDARAQLAPSEWAALEKRARLLSVETSIAIRSRTLRSTALTARAPVGAAGRRAITLTGGTRGYGSALEPPIGYDQRLRGDHSAAPAAAGGDANVPQGQGAVEPGPADLSKLEARVEGLREAVEKMALRGGRLDPEGAVAAVEAEIARRESLTTLDEIGEFGRSALSASVLGSPGRVPRSDASRKSPGDPSGKQRTADVEQDSLEVDPGTRMAAERDAAMAEAKRLRGEMDALQFTVGELSHAVEAADEECAALAKDNQALREALAEKDHDVVEVQAVADSLRAANQRLRDELTDAHNAAIAVRHLISIFVLRLDILLQSSVWDFLWMDCLVVCVRYF